MAKHVKLGKARQDGEMIEGGAETTSRSARPTLPMNADCTAADAPGSSVSKNSRIAGVSSGRSSCKRARVAICFADVSNCHGAGLGTLRMAAEAPS